MVRVPISPIFFEKRAAFAATPRSRPNASSRGMWGAISRRGRLRLARMHACARGGHHCPPNHACMAAGSGKMFAPQMASVYEAVHGRGLDYPARARMIADIATEHQTSSGNTLRDVACGTGRLLEHPRPHFAVEGLDASKAMLEVARARLPGVRLYHARMALFHTRRHYDVITCLGASLCYAQSLKELSSTIRTMRTAPQSGWRRHRRHVAEAGTIRGAGKRRRLAHRCRRAGAQNIGPAAARARRAAHRARISLHGWNRARRNVLLRTAPGDDVQRRRERRRLRVQWFETNPDPRPWPIIPRVLGLRREEVVGSEWIR